MYSLNDEYTANNNHLSITNTPEIILEIEKKEREKAKMASTY